VTEEGGAVEPAPERGADAAATAGPLSCYRHPGVETYVRCVRCDRPICPDCMNSASVGFQCPECVRSGARTVRRPRTRFGGLMPSTVGQVTRLLIGINVVAFIYQQINDRFTVRFELIPFGVDHTILAGVAQGRYDRLITSAFLHANVLHILFNMYALLIVGPTLEAALGRLRFVALYFLSALGGSTVAYLLMPSNGAAVGASGAIFGLFGALFVVTRRVGSDSGGILGLIAINLVLTFTLSGISWQAHVGGLVTGTLIAAAYAYAPRRQQAVIQAGASVVVLLILVAAVAVRTHSLNHPSMADRIPSSASATSDGSVPSRYDAMTTSVSPRSSSSVGTATSRRVVRVVTGPMSGHG
jgi:membrane associated rhomboid family serine protease